MSGFGIAAIVISGLSIIGSAYSIVITRRANVARRRHG